MPAILGVLGSFLTNPKVWNYLFIGAVALFIATKGIEFANSYVDLKVNNAVEEVNNKQLNNQISILKKENDIVAAGAKETQQKQIVIVNKTQGIDKNIASQVSSGKDKTVGPILTQTMDKM